MLKKTSIQYLLGLGLALLTIPIVEGTLTVLPDIGWHFITVIYVTIFVLQITFYYLTTNYKFGWTALSFIVNFILWTFEQVVIEKTFYDSIIYPGENWKIGAYVLGGLLWVTNKILIDQLLNLNKSINRQTSKIHV
ncbi:hypothetical protein [Chryseobacterium sp. MDT2-18]|uniref:hypothetical protein n=1 Tax=Chryseobacterium sp. MDT2-18 TaxID=1259136 RepID=UPI0027868932|nr:hypothetical protein [Chryseobacterium sp. MDT2-18]MDQ0475595.1 hypothetical protein [Chryseobacterium sp. MDT2-18]